MNKWPCIISLPSRGFHTFYVCYVERIIAYEQLWGQSARFIISIIIYMYYKLWILFITIISVNQEVLSAKYELKENGLILLGDQDK